MPEIIVHHLNNSRSQRVLWLLEELELPYSLRRYERDAETLLAPAALREVHPLGKSPVIEDGQRVVAESGAIVEYLAVRHGNGRLLPEPGSDDYWRCRYFMHFAEGSAMPPLLLKLVFDRVASAKMPFFARPIARGIADKVLKGFVLPQIRAQRGYLEAELGDREWFAGRDFSIADIMMSFPLEAAKSRGGLGEESPNLLAWLQRIHARPAYQRALQAGGDYAYAD
ncbi:glutathione S-transferase [Pseudomonas aeruginosa]|uniref:Glutathione S-transferase n=1 Tax=Luteimonas padinae TaxID=1714359 RepID=A0ABV6SRV0_9GAMM|nr:glutathione S-transferase [Luteimonas padinae]EKY0577362.1 glutathione S-transferase [Pseudomonas aeruginosa]EKY0577603.1 glutathione S-transferase [Pseudomonas aeruginosa]GHD75891.1 glutathione S-transferase [Luteimonas padinae]